MIKSVSIAFDWQAFSTCLTLHMENTASSGSPLAAHTVKHIQCLPLQACPFSPVECSIRLALKHAVERLKCPHLSSCLEGVEQWVWPQRLDDHTVERCGLCLTLVSASRTLTAGSLSTSFSACLWPVEEWTWGEGGGEGVTV